jgi:hypothetical protein
MDFEFEKKWKETLEDVSKQFGETLDLNSLIFLIGMQELNLGYIKLTKDQKLEVMHIAVCRLLEPYGYYEYTGFDDDGWPHFQLKEKLPALDKTAQERLMKEAIIDYFSN